jgi:hypothetical protein
MRAELLCNHNRVSLKSKRLIIEMNAANFLVFWRQYHQLKLYHIDPAIVYPDGFFRYSYGKMKNGSFMRLVSS